MLGDPAAGATPKWKAKRRLGERRRFAARDGGGPFHGGSCAGTRFLSNSLARRAVPEMWRIQVATIQATMGSARYWPFERSCGLWAVSQSVAAWEYFQGRGV